MEQHNFLIIEDNPKKLNNLKTWLINKIDGANVVDAVSYTSGIREIYNNCWDLIFLDMSLPTYDITPQEQGGDKKPLAGKEIMRRMMYKKIFSPVIVITQFDTFGDKEISIESLNKDFEMIYSPIWRGTINYDEINTSWMEELERIFTDVMEK